MRQYDNRLMSKFRTLSAVVILVLAAMMSHHRSSVWQDDLSLWQDVAEKNTGKARAYITVGLAYARLQQYREAIAYYDVALHIDPSDPWLHYNLGLLFLDPVVRNVERARIEFEQVLSRYPSDTKAKQMLDFTRQLQAQESHSLPSGK